LTTGVKKIKILIRAGISSIPSHQLALGAKTSGKTCQVEKIKNGNNPPARAYKSGVSCELQENSGFS
jgi:hypothetical protein